MQFMEFNEFKDKEECVLDTEQLNNKLDNFSKQFTNIANEKVDKVDGKGLSTNDYTTSEKQKLEGLSNYVHPSTHDASIINQDSTHRFVTDEEKSKWNSATGVTDEQIDSAVTTYLNANPISGGMTTTAKNLLITILRNALYNTNQSANITALESALASSESGGESGGDTPSVTNYNITNNLTNCANSNVNTSVVENSSYVANITANDGYTLDSVIVTMGGTDITSSAYSDGQINISSVTGNIVITASASETVSQPQLVTDGLENYFDFRNCTYDNGSTTIINATQGNGSLYTWASGFVAEQNANYGIKMNGTRTFLYAGNGGTTETSFGNSFTWIFKCYMNSNISPLFAISYASLNNLKALNYQPKYNTASGTAKVSGKAIGKKGTGYKTFALVVDGNICKLYQDSTLLDTVDGNTIDGFVSWHGSANMNILGGATEGYYTQVALYNKALSEVQLVDMIDYLKSLEVA